MRVLGSADSGGKSVGVGGSRPRWAPYESPMYHDSVLSACGCDRMRVFWARWVVFATPPALVGHARNGCLNEPPSSWHGQKITCSEGARRLSRGSWRDRMTSLGQAGSVGKPAGSGGPARVGCLKGPRKIMILMAC